MKNAAAVAAIGMKAAMAAVKPGATEKHGDGRGRSCHGNIEAK